MRTVLIPMRFGVSHPKWGSREYLRAAYIEKLAARGVVAIPVSTFLAPPMVDVLFASASGILLPGGGDLRPECYGETNLGKSRVTDPREDSLDLRLAQRALAEGKPLLGICRGFQVLAVASGGTLHQHIGDVAAWRDENHGQGNPNLDGSLPEGQIHPVEIDPDSRVAAILGKTRARALSEHHQAVAAVGDALRISGRSPAGVPEILEARRPDSFCIAVQCHPESDTSGDFEPLFDAFAAALER